MSSGPAPRPRARRSESRVLQPPTPRVALLLATGAVVAVVLYLGRAALTPFLLGLVLVYVLDPPVRWLVRRNVPPALAVLAVYAVTLFVLLEGVALLIRPLVDQLAAFLRDLPGFLSALDDQIRRLNDLYNRLDLPAPVREAADRAIAGLASSAQGFDPTALLPVARSIFGTIASIFGFLIVPVWAFYILKDRERLVASFSGALPESWRADTWAILEIIERVFGRWLRGQLFLGLVVGGATFLGMVVLGYVVDARFHQFAVLLAVIAGLLELLPIIGPIISAIPALLVALTISPAAVIAVIVLYTLVQLAENNILVPKIQGDAIELHPSVVIFALVIGGAIGGLLGAIFALPITAAGRDVYRYLFRKLSEEPTREVAIVDVSAAAAQRATAPQGAAGAAQSAQEDQPAPSIGTGLAGPGRQSARRPRKPRRAPAAATSEG